MYKEEKIEVEIPGYTEAQITKEIRICNKCGKEFIWETKNSPNFEFAKIHEIKLNFGYGSGFDMENWEFDLCEDCVLEIIKIFKYVPEGFFRDEHIIYKPEVHQQIFDNWKQTGIWEEFKYYTYEELLEYEGIFTVDFINELIKQYHPGRVLI